MTFVRYTDARERRNEKKMMPAKVIKNKLAFLYLVRQLGNVSGACKVLGHARGNFYRILQLHETGGEIALQEISF